MFPDVHVCHHPTPPPTHTQVFYVDNLDAAENNIDHTVRPRVKAYTYALMKTIIQKDVKSRKGDYPVVYGRLLVRFPTMQVFSHPPSQP